MFIYYLLLLSILIVGKIDSNIVITTGIKKRHKLTSDNLKMILWVGLLTLVYGLRGSTVGTDTANYLYVFLIQNKLASGFSGQEALFAILCKVIGRFTINPQWLLVVVGLIINGCILAFIRHNSKDDTFSVFLYLSLYFYFMSMNGIRQYLAIGFVLIAATFSKRRKLIPFLIFIAIGAGFHTTAVFGIVMWFIYNQNIQIRHMIFIGIIMLLCIVGYTYLIPFINSFFPSYARYTEVNTNYAGIMMPVVYTTIFVFAVFVASFDKKWLMDSDNRALLCVAEVAMIWGIAPFLIRNINPNIAQRLGWLFQIFSIILIPNALESSLFSKNRTEIKILFGLVFIAYMTYFLIMRWHRVTPYYFFWQIQ